MADNFNLRAFLTENKLTKNTQPLKEGKFYAPDYITQKYGAKAKEIEQNIYDAEEAENNPNLWDHFTSLETPEEVDTFIQGFIEENLDEADWRNNPYTPHNFDGVARQARQSKELQAVANRMFPEFGGELENLGAPLTPEQRDAVWSTWSKEKVAKEKAEREKSQIDDEEQANDIEQAQHDMERTIDAQVESALQESRLTAKERRLVAIVENALGIEKEGYHDSDDLEDNVSNDAAYEKAFDTMDESEMVQEKPLPKYNSIEELMKEIEHGTNEAAHKYKMDEMKRVYEALEAKVGSLEEGEHAEHIDQKAVKQMRKDIAALRKAEEKLRKEFDKKFAGKEKKETPAKEKATEALQEGFDLRKFLAENRK